MQDRRPGKRLELCSDDQLVKLVQEQDMDAFVELVSRYMPLVHKIASGFPSGLFEKDDLCQEGMLGLLGAARSYDVRRAAFQTYAGACIRNRFITIYRQETGCKNFPMKDFLSLSQEEGLQVPSPDAAADPEAVVAEGESLDFLKERINKTLSKMERQVLYLYLSGCGFDEIARRLGVEKKAAYNAIQRGREKLRRSFSSSICPGSLKN